MKTILSDYLSTLNLGEPQTFRNTTVVPLFTSASGTPDYLTLTEALAQQTATITEIHTGGHVPQVKVINSSEGFLLLVDGEELIGARQNRTLNTSILVAGKSEAFVPVSCTEAGRWAYKSPHFADAGFVSPHQLRKTKSDSVLRALMMNEGIRADQHQVWAQVDHLCAVSSTKSPTRAMADVMTKLRQELDAFLQRLTPLAVQKGLVVLLNGQVVGLDLLSSPRAYKVLHPKLIRSYGVDALLNQAAVSADKPQGGIHAFFETAKASAERMFPGIACGEDHRFEAPGIAGAALVNEGNILHLNLYRN
jgi:hypothetical protein